MTKKLSWRLKNLPSISELETLVANKIITTDEARDILFNEQEPSKDKEKDLQKQIEFLEDLVKELSKKQAGYPVITPVYVEKWIERNPWQPNKIWCGTTGAIGGTTTAGYSSTSLDSYAQNLIQ